MHILNISRAIKNISANEIRDFISENYCKRIGFSKENSYYVMKRLKEKDLLLLANKLIEQIPDPYNAKEYYQSFIRKKNTKSVKQSEIFTYQPKAFENSYIADIKSVITKHLKSSHRQTEKVGLNSSLYRDTKNVKGF